jgi:hypothetical protein
MKNTVARGSGKRAIFRFDGLKANEKWVKIENLHKSDKFSLAKTRKMGYYNCIVNLQ